MIDATLPFAQPQPLVRVADLALYLRKQGWQRVAHPNERLLVFEKSLGGDRARKLVFASRDEYADAPALIRRTVRMSRSMEWTERANCCQGTPCSSASTSKALEIRAGASAYSSREAKTSLRARSPPRDFSKTSNRSLR